VSETGKKVTLLVIAVVFTLGAGEIVLRAIGYGTITPEMNFGVNTQLSLDKGHRLMATLLAERARDFMNQGGTHR
jgi:hypothetical protein